MTKQIMLLVFTFFLTLAGRAQKILPQTVIKDFCYHAYYEYKYGNGTFKAIVMRTGRNMNLDIVETQIAMEKLSTNSNFRELLFEQIGMFAGFDYQMLAVNLLGLNMNGENARTLALYILDKYAPNERKPTELKNSDSLSKKIKVPSKPVDKDSTNKIKDKPKAVFRAVRSEK